VAALAYLLPPLTGLVAYFRGGSPRVRFHGLQSVALGLVWPAALFACTYVTPGATQAGFAVGALAWLALLVTTALGRDPRLPGIGRVLWRVAAEDPLRPPGARVEEVETEAP
jgi:uncharacterized membrane protein